MLMKKTLLLALVLMIGLSVRSADRNWNFRNWSAATLTNLAADPTNWIQESTTRFSNHVAITDGSSLSANSVPIAETQGLTFGAMSVSSGLGKLRIDYNTNPGRLMLNGGPLKIYIPDCVVGDRITVVTMTASTTAARGITATNATRIAGDATTTNLNRNIFVVTTAGIVTLSTTAGLHFREIDVQSPAKMTTVAGGTTGITAADNVFALDKGYYYRMISYTNPTSNAWGTTPYAAYYNATNSTIGLTSTFSDSDVNQLWDIANFSTVGTDVCYTVKNVGQNKYLYLPASGSAASLTDAASDKFFMYNYGTYTRNSVPYYFWGVNDSAGVVQMNWGRSSTVQRWLAYTKGTTIGHNNSFTFNKVSKYTVDSLFKLQLEPTISMATALIAGTIPEDGTVLSYAAGAKAALKLVLDSANLINTDAYTFAEYKASNTKLTTAIAVFDAAKTAINDDYYLGIDSGYLASKDTSAARVATKSAATMWAVTTNANGYATFASGAKYLSSTGKLDTIPTLFRMAVDGTTVKLYVGTTTNLLTIGGVSSFTLPIASELVYIVNQTFSDTLTTLPTGWSTGTYHYGIATAGTASSQMTVLVDTLAAQKNLKVYISGSTSGSRGIGVLFPTSGTESMVDVEFDWYLSTPSTNANKLTDLNLTDASGNSILYLYAENWTGATNHFHCLNLNPAIKASGAYYDKPLVAIAANQSTLVGNANAAFKTDATYKIKARLDFTNKKIVSLSVVSDTNTAVMTNLAFISSSATSLSKMSCVSYRNESQNNDGTGTSGNGSNVNAMIYRFDNFKVSVTKRVEKEAYYKVYNKNTLGSTLPLMEKMATGTTPETGTLAYTAGAKATYTAAVASAKAVYNNASATADQLLSANTSVINALATFDAAKKAIAADFLIQKDNNFLMATDTSAVYADTVALGNQVAQKKSTLWTVTTDAAGHVTFINGVKYLQTNGKMGTTAASYRFLVDNNKFKLNKVGTSEFLAIGTDSSFSLFTLTIPIKPLVLAGLPSGTAVDTTGAVVKVSFNQNIAVKNANGVKLNGVITSATASGKDLILNYKLDIKTVYTVVIDSGAVMHALDSTLVNNAFTYSFTTYSPFLRDKQTMLGSGSFDGVYALFGPGSANGYTNTLKQIAGNANDSLWCNLSNSLYSQYNMILADTTNKVWNLKNYGSGKYLSYDSITSKMIMSTTPMGWQISLNASSPSTNDYESIYTFWPQVNDRNKFYNTAIKVDSMKMMTPVASGTITTTDYVICPMLSLTYGTPQNFTESSYLKIGARNTGEVSCMIEGDNSVYFSSAPTSTEGSHWKVKRQTNGRYTFQNRLNGKYLTYATDSTVTASATYTPGSDDQEWIFMFHCSKDASTFYTVQGRSRVLYGGTVNGGYTAVTQRNAGNATASSGGCARMCLTTTGVTYVAGEGAPTINVPSVGTKAITIGWNANKEANRYIVRAADTLLYSNGDSIGVDNLGNKIYAQIPYIKDSLCMEIDTISDLTYKLSDLETSVNYYFTVQAMDVNNLLGVLSDIKTVKTVRMDEFTPAAPVVGTVTMKTIALSWLNNEEATSYIVSYWTKADSSDLKTLTVATTSCVISNILANTTVYMTLKLSNGTLVSLPSTSVNATTLLYSTVQMTNTKTAHVRDVEMMVVWNKTVDAASYNLYFTNSASKLTTVTPVNVTDTVCWMKDLTAYTTYYMQVAAVDVAGVSSLKSVAKTQKTGLAGVVNVGYFTLKKTMDATADSVQNDPIYRMLKNDTTLNKGVGLKLNVTLNVVTDNSKTSSIDLTPYNVLIIQESFGGGDSILSPRGPLALAKFPVPTLYNKTYAFKAKRAFEGGTAGTGAEAPTGAYSIKVDAANQTNSLFKGLTFVGDTLQLFKAGATDLGATGTKALNMATSVVINGSTNTMLAYPNGATCTVSLNDIPAGYTIGGQILKTRLMVFGQNFGALCRLNGSNITDANKTIWRNAVCMLAGYDTPSSPITAIESPNASVFSVYPNPTCDVVNINGIDAKSTIKVYNTTGKLLFAEKAGSGNISIDLSRYNAGLYLLQVETNGKAVNTKIIKK
jgi:hypothetical protein